MSTLPQVSVIMPTWGAGLRAGRALDSLGTQTLGDFELIRVAASSRAHLAHALNAGMDRARAPLLAYLPATDLYYACHLQDLRDCLSASPAAVLAYSGMRHPDPRGALQLVQCMHRRTALRWHTCGDWRDLDALFWGRLRHAGAFEYSGDVSCARGEA